ncbi:MAG: hypothetical protein AAF517_16070 [Planctomycetota bacterium]
MMRPLSRLRMIALLLAIGVLLPTVSFAEVDAILQRQIDRAIRRGRDALVPRLIELVKNPPGNHPMGRVALPLAAALKAGLPTKHPVVEEAFKKLDDMPLLQTYDVACYLFALDAMSRQLERQPKGSKSRTFVANTEAKKHVRARILKGVKWLVDARAEYAGHWSYGPLPPRSGAHDISNMQFAILGLQIGLKHRVRIPQQVFVEIAEFFLRARRSGTVKRDVQVKYTRTLEERLERGGTTRVVKARRVLPAGWAYTSRGGNAYPSMSAAGVSSLVVARNGLKGRGKISQEIDSILLSGYSWIGMRLNDFLDETKNVYYTLYSLEKVGDLAGIEEFDGQDWYRLGAQFLVARQNEKGSWNNYINTSFALMFLTRATKMTTTQPTIVTRGSGDGDSFGDYVYISRMDGFVSATEILLLLSETRRSKFLEVAKEAVANFDPRRRGDLAPSLLAMWTGQDRVTRFARDSLRTITGIRRGKRADYELWAEKYQKIRKYEVQREIEASTVIALFEESPWSTLRTRVIRLANRQGHYELLPLLIADLQSTKEPDYRRTLHSTLVRWTRVGRTAPSDDDEKAWENLGADWAVWHGENRDAFQRKVQARRLIARIESVTRGGALTAGGPIEKRVLGLVDDLVAVGTPGLPAIEDATGRESFSIYLLLALERIRGEPIDLGKL